MITKEQLDEVFPKPAIREVAAEVRFAPRLRIVPEIWRVQERLAESYPQIGEEQIPQADGRIVQTFVFSNPQTRRMVKVSQENFVVVFNVYTKFEDFKEEAVSRTRQFSELFDVAAYQRAGLRYVNHIEVSGEPGIEQLGRYVNVAVDLSRFDTRRIEQFLAEFRIRAGEHKLTVRGALIQVPGKTQQFLYILDLDCYGLGHYPAKSLPVLLDEFHHHIQIQFLEHIREDFKSVMRGQS